MKKTKLFIATFLVSLLFIACSNEDGDTTAPVISLISPQEGEELVIGNEKGVHLDMTLSDNEMLRSYKIEIHDNFDGHGHSKSETTGTTHFSFQKTWDISNQKNIKIHHHEIVIPQNATPGNYHLMVYCTDEAGNESYVARNIVLIDN